MDLGCCANLVEDECSAARNSADVVGGLCSELYFFVCQSGDPDARDGLEAGISWYTWVLWSVEYYKADPENLHMLGFGFELGRWYPCERYYPCAVLGKQVKKFLESAKLDAKCQLHPK